MMISFAEKRMCLPLALELLDNEPRPNLFVVYFVIHTLAVTDNGAAALLCLWYFFAVSLSDGVNT